MRTNKKTPQIFTHEGAAAQHINPELQLRRSVMSCMLWEIEFYEDGYSIADRIASMVPQVGAEKCSAMAIEARNKMKLRHVPLLIAREMTRNKMPVSELLAEIIQRPDELTEFLSIYWMGGKCPLSAQVKKGLAKALTKFDEYSLAKYNRGDTIKLRDVLFLCHAKPIDDNQEKLWIKLINNELQVPDTWEVALSSGKDKKETWERLISENKLGGLAILRNLRNMQEVKLSSDTIRQAIKQVKTDRILPFRFIAAARYAPNYEPELEIKLFECVKELKKLSGKTIILVDVSVSMDDPISQKSDMHRIDAACGIAMICRELSDNIEIYSFSNSFANIPLRRGFALRDAIVNSQSHGGTELGKAIELLNRMEYDRLIVFTDEQSHDSVSEPKGKGYMINVASNQNGVGYGKWIHIDGFSEAVINYIIEYENLK